MTAQKKRSSLVSINSLEKLQIRCKQLDHSTSGEAFVDRMHYCSKKLFETYNDPTSFLPPNMTLESRWQNIFATDLSEKEADLQSSIWEFITTEKTYITRLNILVRLYLEMFQRLNDEGDLREIDTFDIFANISEIHRVQEEFWTNFIYPMLKRAREKKDFFCASDLFTSVNKKFSFKENFKCYETLCLREEKCLQYIQDSVELKSVGNNSMLKLMQWLSWCESLALSGRMKLKDLLSELRTRLFRYNILLQGITKRLTNKKEIKFIDEKRKECHAFLLSIENQMLEQVKYRELKTCLQQLEETSSLESEIELDPRNDTSIKNFLCLPIKTTHATLPRFILDERLVKIIRGGHRETVKAVLFSDNFALMVQNKHNSTYQIVNHLYHLDKVDVIKSKRDNNVVVFLYLDELGLLAETFSVELHPNHFDEWICILKKAQCCFKKVLRGESTTFDFYNDPGDHIEPRHHISYKYLEDGQNSPDRYKMQVEEKIIIDDKNDHKTLYKFDKRSLSLDFLDKITDEEKEKEPFEAHRNVFQHKSTQTSFFYSFQFYTCEKKMI